MGVPVRDLRDGSARKAMAAPASDAATRCALCAGLDAGADSPLQRLLPPGRSRFVAQTVRFAVIPTIGCFVPGYVLVVPRVHALSFGQLSLDALDEAEGLLRDMTVRLAAVYHLPVLGFEYGNNVPGGRRIGHAHWHLLPSRAGLQEWLAARLDGQAITGLAGLPRERGASYIAVRGQDSRTTVYLVPNQPRQRIRLRRAVASLDPRVSDDDWDFEQHWFPDLIRQTVEDLAPVPGRAP
jgi:diadenosine tetraphosphate (Ap4A) HIT family hydrolase